MNEQDLALAELIVRVSAIEKILVKKGYFTSDELTEEMKLLTDNIIKVINAGKQGKN